MSKECKPRLETCCLQVIDTDERISFKISKIKTNLISIFDFKRG